MPQLYKHNFYARCENGHKRNFIWIDVSHDKLISIKDYCVICNKKVNYNIMKYWSSIVEDVEI